jgi:hypothetical protein
MKRVYFVVGLLLILFVFAVPGFSYDVWLDEVILFDSSGGGNPADALGDIDSDWVTFGDGETLTLAFTDNTAFDGTGNDLRIREYGIDDATANVYGSANGSDWTFLVLAVGSGGPGSGNFTDIFVDLDGTGLTYVNFLKFIGLDEVGDSPGFDLDAVEALNSGAHVPIPGAAWLLGSGLFGLLALRRKLKA